MKVKHCWFVSIIVLLSVIGIKVLEMMGLNKFLDIFTPSYLVVLCVCFGFIISYIISLFDKKTSEVYLIKKNKLLCIFSLLSAGSIASKSTLNILQSLLYSEFTVLNFIISLLGIFTAVSFVAIALAHLQGQNYLPGIGVLFLSVPVWFCMMLFKLFLQSRVLSAIDINPIKVFAFAFGAMLFLNIPMVMAVIEGKNPVKYSVLFSLSFAPFGIVYGYDTVMSIINDGFDYSENILGFSLFFMAVYSLLFAIEITVNATNKNEYKYSFVDDYIDEFDEMYGRTTDDVAFINDDDRLIPENYDYEVNQREFDDFITEKSEEIIPEDIDEPQFDDVLVGLDVVNDNDSKSEDAIYVDKKAANKFEEKILEKNSSVESRAMFFDEYTDEEKIAGKITRFDGIISQEVMSNEGLRLSFDKIKGELFDDEINDEVISLNKIDKLLLELGSADDFANKTPLDTSLILDTTNETEVTEETETADNVDSPEDNDITKEDNTSGRILI